MGEYTVRPAERGDVAGIQRVARAGWHAAYDDVLGPDTVDDCIDDWYATDSVAEPIADGEILYLVAAVDDRVVGYASAGPTGDDRPESVAGLYSVYVQPDRWGEGIGTTLLDRCTERLRERGFDRLVFDVLAGNEVGVAFYRARGFERLGEKTVELAGREHREHEFGGDL